MNKRPEVDAWFADRAHPLEETMQLARELILTADDRVTESIKWKTPTFSFKGDIVSFSPAKKFVSLMFHRGAEISGQHPRLTGDARLVRVMRFEDSAEVREAADELQAVIKAWCADHDDNSPPAEREVALSNSPEEEATDIDLFAGIPVRDYAEAVVWYERLLGAPPAFLPNDTEAVWELAEHRYVFIEVRPEHAGHAMHTVFLGDFDTRISQIAERGLEPAVRETYDNGVRKATFRDPDGNEIGFGGAPV